MGIRLSSLVLLLVVHLAVSADGGVETTERYDEVVDPSGTVRDHYAQVMKISRGLLPSQIQEFSEKSYKRAHGERKLYPIPRILTQKEDDYLNGAIDQRARAIQAFFEDLNSGRNRVVRSGIIPSDIMTRLLNKAASSFEKAEKTPWENTGFFYGPDIIRHVDGKFYVLEDNTNPGGMADAVEARRDLLEYLPQYRKVLRDGGGETVAGSIARALRAMSKSPDAARVLIVPSTHVRLNFHLIEQLARLGVHTVTETGADVANPNYDKVRINSDSGEPYLRFYRGNEEVGRQKVGAIAIRNFPQAKFRSALPKTFAAFSKGKVPILGYPFNSFDMLEDKELSIYIEKLIPFYLNEEPLITYVPTLSFREVGPGQKTVLKKSVFDQVFNNIRQYVIKDTTGFQGKGVDLGPLLTQDRIEQLKSKIMANPGIYIAQKLVSLSTVGGRITDIRGFAVITKNGVYTSRYKWGRTGSMNDLKVNISLKGLVMPVFVEGRDTLPPPRITGDCVLSAFSKRLGR